MGFGEHNQQWRVFARIAFNVGPLKMSDDRKIGRQVSGSGCGRGTPSSNSPEGRLTEVLDYNLSHVQPVEVNEESDELD